MQQPPLALYIHIPWCVRKCPYCDFNSHTSREALPETAYIDALLADLDADLRSFNEQRPLHSIFIGGGTPSLFSGDSIARLLAGIRQRMAVSKETEITLEANPGTLEQQKFAAFAKAGVNRLSIGIQSFDNHHLQRLGRIHDSAEAQAAANLARQYFSRVNLDLMHGLPHQNLHQALADLQQAIHYDPVHLSWYQLTIEPNTLFGSRPPSLPDDELLWQIQQQGHELLCQAGYQQYEISAYSRPDQQCRHNLNYWRFGDYLGIGCGAHGKITRSDGIIRTEKIRHPKGYLSQKNKNYRKWQVRADDLPFEFFMNRLRLLEPCPRQDFSRLTGLPEQHIRPALDKALALGLLTETASHWQTTAKGQRYLNSLLDLFL